MSIHDHFATFMFKLDRALGYPINRIGVKAPGWMCYTRVEEIGDMLERVHYFFGVVVFAELLD